MNVVMNNGGGFIEVQGTAEGHAFRRHELDALLNLASERHREAVPAADRGADGRLRRPTLAHAGPARGARHRQSRQAAPVLGVVRRVRASTLVRQSEFGIEPPPETGSTFLENALIKARNAARLTGLARDCRRFRHRSRCARRRARACIPRAMPARARATKQNLRKMLLELAGRACRAAHGALSQRHRVRARLPTIRRRWSAKASGKASIAEAPRGSRRLRLRPDLRAARRDRAPPRRCRRELRNERSHRGQAARAFLAQLGARGA